MYRKNRYVMYDQVGSLTTGFNARRSVKRVRQLRVLAQVTVFGLATLSYLVALSLISLI
jgi:hypothetical protein